MFISESKKFIFIHIYKSAGTSIRSALKPHLSFKYKLYAKKDRILHQGGTYHSHMSASNWKDLLNTNYDDYFTFCFVRNPWDLQFSLYNYMLKNKDHYEHQAILKLGSFDEYIKWRTDGNVVLQGSFIHDAQGRNIVNFVGRFENLNDDFESVQLQLGISTKLQILNRSTALNFKEAYSDESHELIRKSYSADILEFGYEA